MIYTHARIVRGQPCWTFANLKRLAGAGNGATAPASMSVRHPRAATDEHEWEAFSRQRNA